VQTIGTVFRTSEQLFALSRPRRARLKAGSWRMATLVIASKVHSNFALGFDLSSCCMCLLRLTSA